MTPNLEIKIKMGNMESTGSNFAKICEFQEAFEMKSFENMTKEDIEKNP